MGIESISYTPLYNSLIHDYIYNGGSLPSELFEFVFIALKCYMYVILFIIICELVIDFIHK